jgi:hypothetical protein
MRHADLTRLPAYDKESGCWHAVIETPRGSRHKFDYAPKLGCFELKKTLPEGMSFPLLSQERALTTAIRSTCWSFWTRPRR